MTPTLAAAHFCASTRSASALLASDFHLTQNGNRHFTLCFQGCGDFHASKNGEPPIHGAGARLLRTEASHLAVGFIDRSANCAAFVRTYQSLKSSGHFQSTDEMPRFSGRRTPLATRRPSPSITEARFGRVRQDSRHIAAKPKLERHLRLLDVQVPDFKRCGRRPVDRQDSSGVAVLD